MHDFEALLNDAHSAEARFHKRLLEALQSNADILTSSPAGGLLCPILTTLLKPKL